MTLISAVIIHTGQDLFGKLSQLISISPNFMHTFHCFKIVKGKRQREGHQLGMPGRELAGQYCVFKVGEAGAGIVV